MDANKSVTAVFVQDQYTLTVNVSGSGSVSLNPTGGTYLSGTSVQLTANADAGWHFDHWTGNLSGSTNPASILMDANKSVTAVFVQDQYTLTVNVTGNGSVDLAPAGGTYLSGTNVQLTADADPGWTFSHWEGHLTGSTNPDSILMDGDKTVTAVFAQDQYTLTVNVTGNGSVDLNPAGGTYASGTNVQLTANADAGWHFDHWTGNLSGSTNPASILMDANKSVTAVFVQDEYTLTVNVSGSGSVSLNPSGGTYLSGTNVQLTANADAGWHFDHWIGHLTGSTNPDSILMDGDKSVTAVFVQDEYTLTVNVTGNGTVDLDPVGGTYLSGTNVDLTAIADPGWHFDHWTGHLTGSTNPESILMDGDKAVTAVFVQDQYTLTVNITGSGSVDLNPTGGTYLSGTNVQLTANADAGWQFDHWEGHLAGSTNPESILMDGDKTVTAVFVQDEYTLTLNVVGNGAVDLDPAGGTYLSGTNVELTANADSGWMFYEWSGHLTGSTNPANLLMDGDKTVAATFVPDCNGNGVPDVDDIDGGASTDFNNNGVPDECEGLGDLNCDGTVDLFDIDPFVLAMTSATDTPPFAGYYAVHPGCDHMHADINGDGVVDLFDIDPFVDMLTSK